MRGRSRGRWREAGGEEVKAREQREGARSAHSPKAYSAATIA